tara:strand:+ start:463 stop:1023 length:561 start_codon:yes stop_codon:yes gene_type:complete
MLFARLDEFPKYRIYINGDIWSENGKRSKWLKHRLNNHGYDYVGLSNGGKQKIFKIHRLLGELFLPCNIDFKIITVDHINRIKTDNRLENLRWANSSEQKLNQDMKDTNSGYPFITKNKSKTNKSGFGFYCRIKRNRKYVLATGRTQLEDAIELVRQTLLENKWVLDGLPEETKLMIKEKYKIRET